MEEILVVLEKLTKSDQPETKLIEQFYKKFAECKFETKNEEVYFTEYVLPKLYILYNRGVFQKSFIYLSLIASGSIHILRKCVQYDQNIFKFNIVDPSSLFKFTIYTKQHWFEKVLHSYDNNKNVFDLEIFNKIMVVKLVYHSNKSSLNLENIQHILDRINKENLDDFWYRYICEIDHFLHIAQFCRSFSPSEIEEDIFLHASKHCLLDTLSNYLKLNKIPEENVISEIRKDEEFHKLTNIQSKTFRVFKLLSKIIQIIYLRDELTVTENVNKNIEDIKTHILKLEDQELQLQLLENIFALLFLKKEHFKFKTNSHKQYTCGEKEIRLILFLLKSILDELKLKSIYKKDSNEYSRFIELNKYVTDALWRLELVVDVKKPKKCEENLLSYMLAAPDSLIQMCLKEGDFSRAYQVVNIFDMEGTPIYHIINFNEKLDILRESLRKSLKTKEFQRLNPNLPLANVELDVNKIVSGFFKTNQIVVSEELEETLNQFVPTNSSLVHFKSSNEIFMNILDLSITQPKNYEDCENMLQFACEYNTLDDSITSFYSIFCKRILESFKEIGTSNKLSITEILTDPKYYLDINKFIREQEFYLNLSELYTEFYRNYNADEYGALNLNHSSHKTLLKINKLCNEYVESYLNTADNTRYLLKLYNYLKAFSKIFYIEQNTSDMISQGKNTSFFALLYYNRSELIGKLLFEKNLDPSEFEKYFGILKLDYLYHVIGNCFPTINLFSHENVTQEELYPECQLYKPSPGIIAYIQKRNWLLAYVLNEMYKVEGVTVDVSEVRIQPFINYLNLPEINHLSKLFKGNWIITALQNEITHQKVSEYISSKILKNERVSVSSDSSSSFETGEEIDEGDLKSTNWRELYDILESIPESQLKNPDLANLRDMVLINLVQDGFELEDYQYVKYIGHRDMRTNIILDNIRKWPGNFCIDIIKAECSKFEIVHDAKIVEMKMWLQQIELCVKLSNILGSRHWSSIYDMCINSPEEIISNLLDTDKVDLLIEYIDLHQTNEDLLLKINQTHLLKIFCNNTPLETIHVLLEHLPKDHALSICYNLLKMLKNLEHLQFVVDYILKNNIDDSIKNVEITLKMLTFFTPSEQEQLLCLLHDPLSVIEILIMNTKFDKLSSCLKILKKDISSVEYEENSICVEKLDELLRKYAEKSLDFRVITQPNPRLLRTPECKLMQSLDSLYLEPKGFIMPEQVPTKSDWIQNNEVLECMSCQSVTFSMFNRRHHCRRCGRIICHNCSTNRMLVPTYGDILVRVCKDCYEQTIGDSNISDSSETTSAKSVVYEYWCLTDDPEHNHIVREEFSYDHAPSVSLCLNIMKFHSTNEAYPKFLLEQCELMLKLLQPSQEPLQEIDYMLVIKMLKSLAVAAKMSAAQCTLHYGSSLADRILSQAELLSLLAERGCLNLLPSVGHVQGTYIDASVLRRLRDKLLEREQWNLALEVSTKAGLDNSGVFAAWGKSSLKAGSLLIAREKFQKCFDRTHHYEGFSDTLNELDEINSNLKVKTRTISKSSMDLSKPLKNPPLLNEIIHILESKAEIISEAVIREAEAQKLCSSTLNLNQNFASSFQPDSAICIINKLKNLSSISSGNYASEKPAKKANSSKPPIDKIFYDECVYYLNKYGSHLSLTLFYIKHGHMNDALKYLVEHRLSTEIFIEIYVKCLKDGIINTLHECMSVIDSTLDIWKDYLTAICCHLEKQGLLNSLYQLQQYMGDYIRAAMTCIRFYEENAMNFSMLLSNSQFLTKAKEHLKQVLEQDQWVEVASVKTSLSKESFEEKGLTNPSLVMKMTGKEIDKHMNTLELQYEVAKFLAECESADGKPIQILEEITTSCKEESERKIKIPTLFGTVTDKKNLAVLTIVCGESIENGFDIALRIMKEFKLKPVKVYNEAGKQLAKTENYNGIVQLVSCIKKSGTNDEIVKDMCDQMLTLAVATMSKANVTGTGVEDLIKLIFDKATKISAYIEAKQLKTAYFLAVKYRRMGDIRRILREAELLNQPSIKALCQKVLQSHSHSPAHSKEKEIRN